MKKKVNNKIIIYDGFCVLCSWSVQLVIKNDKKKVFSFLSLDSEEAQKLRNSLNYSDNINQSVLLIEDEKVYTKSDAALRIAKDLAFPWWILYYFIYIPRFIRNGIYNLIARNRYSLFGKRNSCYIPSND